MLAASICFCGHLLPLLLQVITSGVDVTEAIAIDWVGRNMYWTDHALETIEVASLAADRHRTVLFSQNVTHPRALVLDPSET